MGLNAADFLHEYDLEALELIRPRGHEFEMLVTPRYLEHYVANEYEPFAAALVGALSRSHRLFLDVGAHYGFFSLLAAARNPAIEVLALEPVPETYEVLTRNFGRNRMRSAEPLRRAVSDRSGRDRLKISLSSDNCSFYPHPVAPPIGEIEVQTTTIDELLGDRDPCPTLVKIDTDGHELAVLGGMAETLARFPDLKLLVELNPKMQRLAGHEPEELVAELGRLGFEVFLLDEAVRRAYRMERPSAWPELMARPESYVNLYCCRRETSLSVCFFSHSAGLAGAERSLLELATELVEDHGAVCTVVLPEEGPLRQRLEKAGAATLVAPYAWWCDSPFDRTGTGPPGGFAERLTPSMRELLGGALPELRRIDPHVLVTHTLVIPWGAVLAPVLGKPHVWHVCEFGDLDPDLQFPFPLPEIATVVRDSSSFVFTACDGIRERMFPEADETTCCTLYRHIEVPEDPREDGSPEPPAGSAAVRLGLFGLYSPSKGQDVAVRAAAELVGCGRQIELLLAGHGRDRLEGTLRKLVAQLGLERQVRMEDFIEDVYPAMREVDVVVVGSRMEAFSRVTVEAMLLGKPVVYPDRGGPAEYMEDGVTGLAYAAGDPSAMARAIERLVADPGLRARLGRQARAYARRRFTREAYGGKAVEVLRRLRGAAPRATHRWMELLAASFEELADESGRATERCRALAAERDAALEQAGAAAGEVERLRLEHERLRVEHDELRREREEIGSAAWNLEARLASAEDEIGALRRQRAEAQEVLDTILGGATWSVAVALRKPLDFLSPAGGRLREALKNGLRRLRRRLSRTR